VNTSNLAQQFWEQGYLVLEEPFDSALMDQYQALILEHFGESPAFAHNQEFLTKAATEVKRY